MTYQEFWFVWLVLAFVLALVLMVVWAIVLMVVWRRLR